MSLKAKIEAVIYAAEEPVTLAQLLGVLSQEAQAELQAADARQGQLDLLKAEPVVLEETEAGDPDALNAETLGRAEAPAVEPKLPGAEPGATPGEPSPAAQRAQDRRLREYMRSLLDALMAEYRDGDRGLEIREVAGGFRFATKPEFHDAVRGFVRSLKPPLKLSLQALETLAVVAYKQPVTAPEVSEIRGVDSAGVLGSLIGRKLVATAGRKQVIGRPILYKTTKEFLLRFGLKDVNDLPSIEEFERLAADLNEAVQEEIEMPEQTVVPVGAVVDEGRLSTAEVEQDLEPNREVHAAQADGDPGEDAAPAGELDENTVLPSADNVAVDGRISGVPAMYDEPNDELPDSPAQDAAVQAEEQKGN